MKAKLILFCALTALCGNAFAQDIIHTIDGRSIEAKVLEISDDDILYKTFDNLDGPNYRMSVSRVARIVFQNGTEKSFAPADLFASSPYAYGPLEYRWGHFYDRHGRVHADDLRDYLGVSLYGSEYRKANNQFDGGMWLTVGGGCLVITSVVCSAMQSDYNRGVAEMHMGGSSSSSSMGALYIGAGIVGAACLGIGIPLMIKGSKRLNAIADDYNQRYGAKAYGYNPTLNIGPTPNGLGLALNF